MTALKTACGHAAALLLAGQLAACTEPGPSAASVGMTGISGMAQIDGSRYLVVRDLKDSEDGARMGILALNDDRPYDIADVTVTDWVHADGRPSDLEAACAIPGRNDEFLLLESGHWQGRFGRLFRVRLVLSGETYRAAVVHVFEVPEFDPKGPGDPGDEMEGLACAAKNDGRIVAILGERGGSSVYPNGRVRWFTIDVEANSVTWTEPGRAGLAVDAPGEWQDRLTNRDVSALHLRSDGSLWAVAAEDLSDAGPFSSIVYRIGEVLPDDETPVRLHVPFRVNGIVSGFKVEALASGPSSIPDADFAIGTEDEIFGGSWRPLR